MVNFKENEELKTLNHSCAHLMAQAIKHLYPQAKFWVGPVVAEGFYYDVDLGVDVIRDEDIEKIEKEMKKIIKKINISYITFIKLCSAVNCLNMSRNKIISNNNIYIFLT